MYKYLHIEIFDDQSLLLQNHFAIQHKDTKFLSILGMQFLKIYKISDIKISVINISVI